MSCVYLLIIFYGGLAEAFRFDDKRLWLTSLNQKVLSSYIIVRKGIRNERSMSLLIRKLADSVMQPMAIKRFQNILQDDGTKISRATITTYISYLKEAFLCFSIPNFTDTPLQREILQKHYFYDNGIPNLFLINPNAKLLENLIAITLYRKYGDSLYYYNYGVDVDFYIPSEQADIQVSYEMLNADTRNHKVIALLKLNAYKPLKRLMIITYNKENTLPKKGLTIKIMPIWKWLIDDSLGTK